LRDFAGCSDSATALGNTDMDRPEDGTEGWMTWLDLCSFETSAHDRAFNPQPYLSQANLLSALPASVWKVSP